MKRLLVVALVLLIFATTYATASVQPTETAATTHHFFFDTTSLNSTATTTTSSTRSTLAGGLGAACTPETARICGYEFVCRDGVCTTCIDDSECPDSYVCHKYDPSSNTTRSSRTKNYNYCTHKSLFPHFDRWDALATVCTFVGSSMASSSGIGGGGLYVPMLVLLGRFHSKLAIPISKAMIFGGSIANIIIYVRQRHPKANRPLIDYNIALTYQPFILMGTIFGVLFNVMFPKLIILVLLVIAFLFTGYKTTQKGISLWKQERKKAQEKQSASATTATATGTATAPAKEQQQQQQQQPDDEKGIEMKQSTSTATITTTATGSTIQEQDEPQSEEVKEEDIEQHEKMDVQLLEEQQAQLDEILADESKSVPVIKILALILALFIVFVPTVLKGSKTVPSFIGVEPCGVVYWMLLFLPLPILGMLTGVVLYMVRKQYKKKLACNFQFVDGDVRWTPRNLFLLPSITFVAGVAASMLGIGGGIVTTPLMLSMGTHPQVTVATSSFMILWTAASATAQYGLSGLLPLDYGLWFGAHGFLSAMLGQFAISWVVKKTGKSSVVVCLLAAVIFLSVLLMLASGIYDLVLDAKAGIALLAFQKPC